MTSPSATPAPRAHAVYVSNAESGDVAMLRLDNRTGTLTLEQRIEIGGTPMPMALSPDRRWLFVAQRAEPWSVSSFAIEPASGQLTLLGSGTLPQSMAFIATDRSGRFLFSASYGGDLVAVSRIGADGIVQPARQVLPTEPRAHAIQADPSNRFVFATSLGGGIVMQQRFDERSGQLTPNVPSRMAPHAHASPRHFVFGADTRFVYLLNELDAALDVLAFDSAAGTLRCVQTLATLPPDFNAATLGAPWAADLHVTPDGRFLYTTERRSSTLASFSVDPASGLLTPIGHTPTQAQPRGFHITADGRFLVVAGQRSHRLGVYAIAPLTGALVWLSEAAAGRGPNWIETLPLA